MILREVTIDLFLALGVALVLVSCLGMVCFNDVYDRLHFCAPATLGAVCITVAVLVRESFSLVGDKTILITVFMLAAAPLVTHAIGRAARACERGESRPQPQEQIEVEEADC